MLASRMVLSGSSSVEEFSGMNNSANNRETVAQKLLENLYNYAMSFGMQMDSSGQSYLPVKVFQDWYSNVEKKIKMDPSFLK